MKTAYWRIITAILISASAGTLLKLFDLNTYIILLGFRFHLSCVVPFLFIIGTYLLHHIREAFANPPFKRNFFFILIIFLPLTAIVAGLYIMKFVELGDPEYFYEFGLSSIVDYPTYLIWNSLQLFMLFFFLESAAKTIKFSFITVFFTLVLLFGYEFIPAAKQQLQYIDMGIFIVISLIASLLISKYRNVYWFTVTLFSLIWSSVLLFGSSSKGIINNLFASQYNSWEGLLEVSKLISPYAIIIYITIALLICLTGLGMSRTKHGT